MKLDDLNFGADENCVMQYLNNFPHELINVMEIARRAGSRERFLEDSHWAHNALAQLLEVGLVETDGSGKFRLKSGQPMAGKPAKKFIDPKLRQILEHSGRNIDLSRFA